MELRIPPLVTALVCALMMWLMAAATPALALPLPWRYGLGAAMFGIGFWFAGAGVMAFRKARTSVDPTAPEKASAVVKAGVYRFSRNPMYVGFLLALAGWAAVLAHALAVVVLPAFVAYMNRFQIVPEERALLAKFGREYEEYLQSVRRWL